MPQGSETVRTWRVRRCIQVGVLLGLLPVFWRYGDGCRSSPSGETTDWRRRIVQRFELRPRDRWDARAPTHAPADLDVPSRVTIHHSGGREFERVGLEEVARSIRAIQREHQQGRGWADIGYHYIIDPRGGVWEGRDSRLVGAHAGSAKLNEGNLGVLLLGNFETQQPTDEQLVALAELLLLVRELCGIPVSEIYTHNEIRTAAGLAATACPGRHLTARLEGMRQ